MNAKKLTAKIKLQSAIALARDLRAERTTDPAVFTRMVDHRGKQLVTRDSAESTARRLVDEAWGEWPVTGRMLKLVIDNFKNGFIIRG